MRFFKLYVFSISTLLLLAVPSQAAGSLWPSLELKGVYFPSEDYENTSEKTFPFVGLSIRDSKDDFGLGYGVDATGNYAVTNSVLSYLNVRDLYLSYSWLAGDADTVQKAQFGRIRKDWSLMDQTWNLGFFEPQMRWNSLDPERQGLTGFFYEIKSDFNKDSQIKITVFGSPLFIPDQGPGFELKDGDFLDTNPWFIPPPRRVQFEDQIFEVDYTIEMPQISDILFQTSFGGMMRLEGSGWYSQASAVSKPSHQLSLGFKGALVANKVKADVLPKLYREQIYALDVGYADKVIDLGLGVISVNPESPEYTDDYNYSVVQKSISWGPKFSWAIDPAWSLWAAGLMTEGGELKEKGPDAGTLTTPLSYKYLFREAYKLGIAYKINIEKKYQLKNSLEWTETFKDWSKMLKFQSVFVLNGPFSLSLDVLMIETKETPSTLSNSRNLDQVWLGAVYDF